MDNKKRELQSNSNENLKEPIKGLSKKNKKGINKIFQSVIERFKDIFFIYIKE